MYRSVYWKVHTFVGGKREPCPNAPLSRPYHFPWWTFEKKKCRDVLCTPRNSSQCKAIDTENPKSLFVCRLLTLSHTLSLDRSIEKIIYHKIKQANPIAAAIANALARAMAPEFASGPQHGRL